MLASSTNEFHSTANDETYGLLLPSLDRTASPEQSFMNKYSKHTSLSNLVASYRLTSLIKDYIIIADALGTNNLKETAPISYCDVASDLCTCTCGEEKN